MSRHVSNAVAAAAYARSTSSAPETGAVPKTSPVLGSTRSLVRPVGGVDGLAVDEVAQGALVAHAISRVPGPMGARRAARETVADAEVTP